MSYNPSIHHRRSIRLKGYDYTSSGAYFVTMCTRDRACTLGDIVRGTVMLSNIGRIVAQSWVWLGDHHPYVDLDAWVIMPNHVHGIILILDDDIVPCDRRGGSRTALTAAVTTAPTTKRKPLGRLIGAFKTVSTKRINEIRHTPGDRFWQRNYWEHIIRDESSLAQIRQYVINDPARWVDDRLHPTQPPLRPD